MFEDDGCVYMILDLCPNGSLKDLLKSREKLGEIEVRCYMQQLLHAVKYMHSKSVVHRDLKLANLLLTADMTLQICDFGLSSKINCFERRTTFCGTPLYMAPEIIG